MSPLGPKRQFLRRNHTPEVGGEADMPRQLNRRIMTHLCHRRQIFAGMHNAALW